MTLLIIWGVIFLPKQKGRRNVPPDMQKGVVHQQKAISNQTFKDMHLTNIVNKLNLDTISLEKDAIYDPFVKLDPKILMKDSPAEISEIVLSGIMWDEKHPVALINGEIMKKGDVIFSFKLEEISRNEVVLTRGSERHVLQLPLGSSSQ